jgi:hypothetical protein
LTRDHYGAVYFDTVGGYAGHGYYCFIAGFQFRHMNSTRPQFREYVVIAATHRYFRLRLLRLHFTFIKPLLDFSLMPTLLEYRMPHSHIASSRQIGFRAYDEMGYATLDARLNALSHARLGRFRAAAAGLYYFR